MRIALKDYAPKASAYELDPTKKYLVVIKDEGMTEEGLVQVRRAFNKAGVKGIFVAVTDYTELTLLEQSDV